jgi:hypothetical protein
MNNTKPTIYKKDLQANLNTNPFVERCEGMPEGDWTLGGTVAESETNINLTATVLPTTPLAYNQDVKVGKGKKLDKVQSAAYIQHYYPA